MKNVLFLLFFPSFIITQNLNSMQFLSWFYGSGKSTTQLKEESSSGSGKSSEQTHGLTADEIINRDSMAYAIQKSHSILSKEEATAIATGFFVSRQKVVFWGDLNRKLQEIQQRLPRENCIQALCKASNDTIFMAVIDGILTQAEIEKRNNLTKCLVESHPGLLEKDAAIIASSFFINTTMICERGKWFNYSVLEVANGLKNIQVKFQEQNCVHALCEAQYEKMCDVEGYFAIRMPVDLDGLGL